jgi:hypothetical protein
MYLPLLSMSLVIKILCLIMMMNFWLMNFIKILRLMKQVKVMDKLLKQQEKFTYS